MNLEIEPVSLQEFVVRTAGQPVDTAVTERISA